MATKVRPSTRTKVPVKNVPNDDLDKALAKGLIKEDGGLAEPVLEVVNAWNEMVTKLQEAEYIWEERIKKADRSIFGMIPSRNAGVIVNYRLSPFDIMLDKFIVLWKGYGGLEKQKIKLKEAENG